MEFPDFADSDVLARVVRGQQKRRILEGSRGQYLCLAKTVIDMSLKNPSVANDFLEPKVNGEYQKYTGEASKLYRIKLPVKVHDAQKLWAMISCDPSLPKGAKRKRNGENVQAGPVVAIPVDPQNPALNYRTVSKQVYQNYKSAFKWFHELDDEDMSKKGFPWPDDVDAALVTAIASYKRDVAKKKRRGVMKQKEGKSVSLHDPII